MRFAREDYPTLSFRSDPATSEALAEIDDLRAALRYMTQPTMGYDPGTHGTIEECIWVTPERSVRISLAGIVSIAKETLAKHEGRQH